MEFSPYAEVNAVLAALLAGAQGVLGEDFLGLYVYGSLASGDFNLATSDIDFVVVTSGRPPAESDAWTRGLWPEVVAASLREMHAALIAGGNPWAKRLEGAYVPAWALRSHAAALLTSPPGRGAGGEGAGANAAGAHTGAPLQCPTTNEGKFYLAPLTDSDWIIRRHLLCKAALVLAGSPPTELIDPVTPEELKRSVGGFLREWWQPMIEHSPAVPYRLEDDEYQRYAVLTMCRILNTLIAGDFLSKAAAGRWALAALDARWRPLIEQALAWQPGERMDALNETEALIRYVTAFERSNVLTL